jgi:hypothetical protein
MAKARSIITLQGTLKDVTYVESKRYGYHARAARGTHKRAVMNDACNEVGEQVIRSNKPALQIHQTLRPYRTNFKGGSLWSRLISVFRKHYSKHGKFDFRVVENMEVHEEHRLEQYILLDVSTFIDRKSSRLRVTLDYQSKPIFARAAYIDGYCFTVIAIYPDLRKEAARATAVTSPVIDLKSKERQQSFTLPMPKTAKEFVLCVKLEGTEHGKITPGYTTKGMRIVKVGSGGVGK